MSEFDGSLEIHATHQLKLSLARPRCPAQGCCGEFPQDGGRELDAPVEEGTPGGATCPEYSVDKASRAQAGALDPLIETLP